MRLTVITEDGSVGKEGVFYSGLDLSFLANDISAFQWYGTYGEIEYKSFLVEGKIVKPENIFVQELGVFERAIQVWEQADNAYKASLIKEVTPNV